MKNIFTLSLLLVAVMAVACSGPSDKTQVISRREFKVLGRAKPEHYVDDDIIREIIYDGGMEL